MIRNGGIALALISDPLLLEVNFHSCFSFVISFCLRVVVLLVVLVLVSSRYIDVVVELVLLARNMYE